MAMQYSVTVNNARLDAVETAVASTAVLKIFSGSQPANCAASDPAGPLVTITLPSDWMAAATSATKAKSGTWSGTASAAGTAACFRIYEATATTCHIQGSVGLGTGDLSLDNTSISTSQTVTISTFQLNAANT